MKHLFKNVFVHHRSIALDHPVTIKQRLKAPLRRAKATATASRT